MEKHYTFSDFFFFTIFTPSYYFLSQPFPFLSSLSLSLQSYWDYRSFDLFSFTFIEFIVSRLDILSTILNSHFTFFLFFFLYSIGVLLSNTKKVYHHFYATFKSFSTFFVWKLLLFSASLLSFCMIIDLSS
jgi:hypothetical protein